MQTAFTAAVSSSAESPTSALCSPLTAVQARLALALFHSVGLQLLANSSKVFIGNASDCVGAVKPTFLSCKASDNDDGHHAVAAVTVHNVSMHLMRIGGISRRLPAKAWASSFIVCMYDHRYRHLLRRQDHHRPQVRLYRENGDGTFSISEEAMRQAWLYIIAAPRQQQKKSCTGGGTDQCALQGYWSFAHLNEVDDNGVPTLVCNSQGCAVVDRPAAVATEPTLLTMDRALRMSGWVHQTGDDGDSTESAGGKANADWKRFFYNHLHLEWFQVQPVSSSSFARAQFASAQRMSTEESVLRGWRIFLLVVSSVFLVYVLYRLFREWQSKRAEREGEGCGDGGGAEVADQLAALVALALFAPFTSHRIIVADALASLVVAIAFLVLQVFVSTWAWCHYFDKKNGDHCQRVKNALFLKERLAVCRGRFAVLALGLTVYLVASKHRCVGYRGGGLRAVEDSSAAQRGGDKARAGLVYSLCACFYCTIQVAQLVRLTKQVEEPLQQQWLFWSSRVFRVVGIGLVAATLVHGLAI